MRQGEESAFPTVLDNLSFRAEQQAKEPAYTFLAEGDEERESYSFSDLECRARAVAACLQELGAAGKTVLLLYPPGIEFVAAFCGVLYAGAIAVPAPPPEPARLKRSLPRLQAIVRDSGSSLVLTTAGIVATLEQQSARLPEFRGARWVTSEEIPLAGADLWRDPGATGDTLAYLQYTSGSTSTPKGVMITHGNLMANCAYSRKLWRYGSDSVSANWMPYFHDYGLVEGLIGPLYSGTPCYLLPPLAFLRYPARWLQVISSYRVTHSAGPSFAYDHCVERVSDEECAGLDLSSWRVASTGAEVVRADTLASFADRFARFGFRRSAFFPAYGLAEATLLVTTKLQSEPPVLLAVQSAELTRGRVVEAQPGSLGAQTVVGSGGCLDGVRVEIVEPETGLRCEPGRVGEIWVAGSSVARGYWERPEESAQTFGARLADTGEGPFLRTGDLGFLRDGELFVSGRLKEVIIIRGSNYYPRDIEATVEKSHPVLRSNGSAAFSIDTGEEERLVVVVEVERVFTRENRDEVAGAVRRAISEMHDLQVYDVKFIRRGSILKTSSGKVQRQGMREAYLAGTLALVGEPAMPAAPATPALRSEPSREPGSLTPDGVRQWLVGWVSRELRLPEGEIDPRNTFASFGLDSNRAVRLAHDVEVWWGRPRPNTLAWDFPDLESLAAHLAGVVGATASWRAPAPSPICDENLERLLGEIELLTEDEAESALI